MATTTSHRKRQAKGVLEDAPGHITKTLGATVTEKPSRPELAFDLLLLAAGAVEAISPPVHLPDWR
jgi:hypothetical protein